MGVLVLCSPVDLRVAAMAPHRPCGQVERVSLAHSTGIDYSSSHQRFIEGIADKMEGELWETNSSTWSALAGVIAGH